MRRLHLFALAATTALGTVTLGACDSYNSSVYVEAAESFVTLDPTTGDLRVEANLTVSPYFDRGSVALDSVDVALDQVVDFSSSPIPLEVQATPVNPADWPIKPNASTGALILVHVVGSVTVPESFRNGCVGFGFEGTAHFLTDFGPSDSSFYFSGDSQCN
jgi:hypothetical protein